MKKIYLLFAGLALVACSKEKTHGPWNLKDGQEVEVQVSHRYGATDDDLTLIPQNKTEKGSIYSFDTREPGYNYRVKARMVAPDVPPQDGPSYWLEFVKVINKEKYTGNDPFILELVSGGGMVGYHIALRKEGDKYQMGSGKVILRASTPVITAQLEEIWMYIQEHIANRDMAPNAQLKWKSIKVTVTHDPADFGKTYLVSNIQFTE